MTEPTRETPPVCEICGEPMPPGEEMFKFHGYSGPCPKPPRAEPSPAPALHLETLERCIEAVERERLAEPQQGTNDEVYEQAISDALRALESLRPLMGGQT